MIGTKFQKPLQDNFILNSDGTTSVNTAPNTLSKYNEVAKWCNENKTAEMQDKGDYYECVAIPEPTLEERKKAKLADLESLYLQWRTDDAVVVSSLGFTADSDERANTDVIGLITAFGDNETVMFRDADNQYHQLTLDQLKILQKEIIQNGQYSYQQKWGFESQVNSAESKEALDAILIEFKPADFGVTTEQTITIPTVGL